MRGKSRRRRPTHTSGVRLLGTRIAIESYGCLAWRGQLTTTWQPRFPWSVLWSSGHLQLRLLLILAWLLGCCCSWCCCGRSAHAAPRRGSSKTTAFVLHLVVVGLLSAGQSRCCLVGSVSASFVEGQALVEEITSNGAEVNGPYDAGDRERRARQRQRVLCEATEPGRAARRSGREDRSPGRGANYSIRLLVQLTQQGRDCMVDNVPLKHRAWVANRDGTYRTTNVPGPDSYDVWYSCWRVCAACCSGLRWPQAVGGRNYVLTPAALEYYQVNFRQLAQEYGECWFLCCKAEYACRAEHLTRTRRRLMATNGGAQVSWSDVFVKVANDNKYWDREVHRPAMLDLARGKRGDEPTAADEEDPSGLTTCSRRCAPVWSRSRSPASNQGAARLLPSLAVQFAIFFFVELFAGAASRSAAGAGVGCRGTRRACGRRVASFRGGLVAGRLLALLLVGSMGGIAGVIPWAKAFAAILQAAAHEESEAPSARAAKRRTKRPAHLRFATKPAVQALTWTRKWLQGRLLDASGRLLLPLTRTFTGRGEDDAGSRMVLRCDASPWGLRWPPRAGRRRPVVLGGRGLGALQACGSSFA